MERIKIVLAYLKKPGEISCCGLLYAGLLQSRVMKEKKIVSFVKKMVHGTCSHILIMDQPLNKRCLHC